MKKATAVSCALVPLCIFAFASSTVSAGEIFGKVLKGGAPVGEGAASVELQCGDTAVPPVKTDKSGAYHLVANKSGKCTLTVKQGEQAASLGIASYDEAVQVDLVLEVQDGKLSVRRK